MMSQPPKLDPFRSAPIQATGGQHGHPSQSVFKRGTGHTPRDYARNPMNVYWEMTQACSLACRHCRAEAMPEPNPDQLTLDEGISLLDQIASFDQPLPQLVMTGGDPLEHPNLLTLLDAARSRGIEPAITPAATTLVTYDRLKQLADHGVSAFGLSLDGSSPQRHDAIRGVPGTFLRTLQAIQWAEALTIPVQVNTLVSEDTADDLPAIFELLSRTQIARWSLFFLVSVGRGKTLTPLSAEEGERVMAWAFEQSLIAPFMVVTTEAPAYRRVVLERMRERGMGNAEVQRHPAMRGGGIRDGHGVVFVSNTGDIYPAGFLPVTVGNIRRDHLVNVYRASPIFERLHQSVTFEGNCGSCEYHGLCGGSRARAFAATGSPFGSDPFCTFQPTSSVPRFEPSRG